MAAKPLPEELAKVVESFKLLADEVNPAIAVTAKLKDGRLIMEAMIAPENLKGKDDKPLEKIFRMVRPSMEPTFDKDAPKLNFVSSQRPGKSKLVYSFDASGSEAALATLQSDMTIVRFNMLADDLQQLSRDSIKAGNTPQTVVAALDLAQTELGPLGKNAEPQQHSLRELTDKVKSKVKAYLERGGDPVYADHSIISTIEYINQHSIGGVWQGGDKGRGGRAH